MAVKKNTKTKSGGAKRSSAKTKSNTAKKNTSAKRTKTTSADEIRERESRRFWSYILFFFGIFQLLVTFIKGDGLWYTLHLAVRGIFGVSVFLTAPFLIYIALVVASEKMHVSAPAKITEGIILLLLISGFAQTVMVGKVSGSGFWDKIGFLYDCGKTLDGGGVAAAFIGWPMLYLFKRVGAAIIIFLVGFTFVMLLTNVTLPQLLKGLFKPVVKSAQAVNEDRINRAQVSRKKSGGSRIDIAKFYPDDEPETAPEVFSHVREGEEPKGDGGELPMHPVSSPAITVDKLEKTAKSTDNKELKRIIEKAIGDNRKDDGKSKKTAVKINVESDGQTTLFEKDNKISAYVSPPVDILKYPKTVVPKSQVEAEIEEKSHRLVETLDTYGVKTKIVGIHRGPTVTRYELQPAAGVRVAKILGLADDIALNLAAASVRIEAPVPGKAAVGIEVPNDHRDSVSLRELIDSEEYRSAKSKLGFAVGKDIEGKILVGDLAKMPHMLVAGTTGSGKSVFTNSIILSILYHASPDEVKLILIDPKKVEFPIYNKIPHLLIPVVTEPLKAAGALGWAVNEMNKRYLAFEANNVKNLQEFNDMVKAERKKPEEEQDEITAGLDLMPQIVIVVDEFADLMMAAGKEVEDSVTRIAQLARAAGIHMIIATQSPRKDVITGLIKTNIPSRVSLSVASNIDSRVILDEGGAEKLLGYGDLLYKPVGVKKPIRVQSGYATTTEIKQVVSFLKNEHDSEYSEEIIHEVEENTPKPKESGDVGENISINPDDDLINQAIAVIVQTGNASTAFLQRKLKLGFPRAARIMDEIEEMGIIGPQEGAKPRKINITEQEWIEMQARR